MPYDTNKVAAQRRRFRGRQFNGSGARFDCPVAGFPALDSKQSRCTIRPPLGRTTTMRFLTVRRFGTLLIAPLTLWVAPAALAQEDRPTPVQIVALDECDPATFNAVLPDFSKNVTLAPVFHFACLAGCFANVLTIYRLSGDAISHASSPATGVDCVQRTAARGCGCQPESSL